MKKVLTITLATILALSLAACGDEPAASSTPLISREDAAQSTAASAAPVAAGESEPKPEGNPYTLQVEITGGKTAVFAISDVSAGDKNPDGEQRRWEVVFGGYSIQLKDKGDGNLKCQGGVENANGTWDYPYEQTYSIEGTTLYLQASFAETDVNFGAIDQFELQVKEPSGYTVASLPAADVVVDKPLAASSSTPASAESNPAESTSPSNEKPIGEFYSGDGELLTITSDKISFQNEGRDYSAAYPATAPETVDDSTKKLTFTANGSSIELYFSPSDFSLNQSKSVQVLVDGKPTTYITRAKGNFAAMAGSYQGQSGDVLIVSEDGSFTFTIPDASKLSKPLAGTIPADHKSGDKITVGEYTVALYYGSDYAGMSVEIKAGNQTIFSTDMVRG